MTCPDCGHQHTGVELGQICVGCPCLSVPAILGPPRRHPARVIGGPWWHRYSGTADDGMEFTITIGPSDSSPTTRTLSCWDAECGYVESFDHDPDTDGDVPPVGNST